MAQKNETKAVVDPADLMSDAERFRAMLEQDAKGEATADEIREQLGDSAPEIEAIEIKHQGANLIQFPDGETVQGKDGITCVILASTFHNAHYAEGFDEGEPGERPDCKSADAVTIDADIESPKAENCASCPLNRAALSDDARESAFARDRDECCNNSLTLILAIPGHQMPYKLKLSVKSQQAFRKYATRVGSKTRFLLHEVATQLTFEAVGKFKHSEARFSMLGALPEPLREANREASAGYLSYLRRTANRSKTESAEDEAKAAARKAAKGAEKSSDDELPL
jgi:hypothetical protein